MRIFIKANSEDVEAVELWTESTTLKNKYLWAIIHIDFFGELDINMRDLLIEQKETLEIEIKAYS